MRNSTQVRNIFTDKTIDLDRLKVKTKQHHI
jgi:hypothetical protein